MKKTEIKRKTAMKPGKGFAAMRTELRRTKLAPVSGKKAAGRAVAMRASIRRKASVPATAEQRARWDRIIGLGCVACYMNASILRLRRASYLYVRTEKLEAGKLEIHHLLLGRKRMGHDFTVNLCRYHHQGDFLPQAGSSYADQAAIYGPSFGHEPRRFREVYGRELTLLAYQNDLLANPPVLMTLGLDIATDRIEIEVVDWGKSGKDWLYRKDGSL